MGMHYSSDQQREGTIYTMAKLWVLLFLSSFYVSTNAYSYGLTRFGLYGYPRSSSYVYNSYNWPGVSGPVFESTCWGCRGKRSADPEPGYLGYGYGLSTLGYGYGYGLSGIGYHGLGGYSYTQRSPQGLGGYRAYIG